MRVASIGECMVEFSAATDGLFARGFGGDTLNTALKASLYDRFWREADIRRSVRSEKCHKLPDLRRLIYPQLWQRVACTSKHVKSVS
jgi:hypothetical protein